MRLTTTLLGTYLLGAAMGLGAPARAAGPPAPIEDSAPYVLLAKEKYDAGDYFPARDLCEAVLKQERSPDCEVTLKRSKELLERLAEESYRHGCLLEDLNLVENAKQYWTRAMSYVAEGDKFYAPIQERLTHYR